MKVKILLISALVVTLALAAVGTAYADELSGEPGPGAGVTVGVVPGESVKVVVSLPNGRGIEKDDIRRIVIEIGGRPQ
ncbi:MAG: hypothetical protein HY533_06770 [Chloroflexi bacterium]|nr:hypothetical protein [Chloroflexota bacterium]